MVHLKKLADQLPISFIIIGDFNGHKPVWVSKTTNDKGKKGLCIFNNDTDTYLHPGNGSYSAIDSNGTDSSLLLDFSWNVHDDLFGSDHFPII